MGKFKSKSIYFLRILRNFMVTMGIFFSIGVLLAFTEQPYWGYHWLGTSKSGLRWEPAHVILLGGGGMPSQSNLMRAWFAAKAARAFPQAKVWVAIPGDLTDSAGTPRLMQQELILRGIQLNRIGFESEATNTRAQALNAKKTIKMQAPILIVTSPEHMRRSVLCFQKAGFDKVDALPAFENALEADLAFADDALGGRKTALPDVGENTNVRYQVWNHLKYEILIAREMAALAYYKLRGWI